MRVAITGSSGLIGTALQHRLRAVGHEPVPMVRGRPGEGEISWNPASGYLDPAAVRDVDAVVNLAGAGIGDKKWSPARKREIRDSRIVTTAALAEALAAADDGPRILLSGSAIGYYGNRGDDVLTEADGPGDDFPARLCVDWEGAAQAAVDDGVRTAFLRTGTVQAIEGGALAKMLTPFKLGLGGRIGSGRQWWSWISLDDEVRAIVHLLDHDVSGPVNLTAPEPARVNDYVKALGETLRRPTVIPTPSFAPRLLVGKEAADALMLTSQRIVPNVLVESGFEFRHPTIRSCFEALLGDEEVA